MEEGSAVFGTSAAAAPSSSSISFNKDYMLTPEGALKFLHFLFGMVVFGLVASTRIFLFYNPAAYQFIMVVSVISWVLSTVLLVIFLLGVNSGAGVAVPWAIIEFVYHAICALMYFIAASVQAAYTYHIEHLVAAAVIAYLVFIAYLLHAFFSFRSWKGYFPWESRSYGNEVEA